MKDKLFKINENTKINIKNYIYHSKDIVEMIVQSNEDWPYLDDYDMDELYREAYDAVNECGDVYAVAKYKYYKTCDYREQRDDINTNLTWWLNETLLNLVLENNKGKEFNQFLKDKFRTKIVDEKIYKELEASFLKEKPMEYSY
ncbi:hypothetical protein [Mycoplasmopsis gallinacea]|uniref:Uncharacterized protein n=1 Tax=Mycoplasmopsis gallinacea TaxID=29556 RepID=A0A6H0V2D1_9BACT|nr:hypothetical protein [Mycoplasmopsis gallinacea]QIW62352.1 hypothetical protein GOQ20_02870 [Mycoplasmopsis gallinacea]